MLEYTALHVGDTGLSHNAQRSYEIKSVGGIELLRASTAYLFRFRKRRHYFVSVQRQDFLRRIHASLTAEAENSLRHRTHTGLVASVSCAGNARGCVRTIIVRFTIMRTRCGWMHCVFMCGSLWASVQVNLCSQTAGLWRWEEGRKQPTKWHKSTGSGIMGRYVSIVDTPMYRFSWSKPVFSWLQVGNIPNVYHFKLVDTDRSSRQRRFDVSTHHKTLALHSESEVGV